MPAVSLGLTATTKDHPAETSTSTAAAPATDASRDLPRATEDAAAMLALHRAAARRFAGTPVSFAGDAPPSIHLYHAPNSICSQKVRAVLAATERPYVSHLLDIFQGHTYDPDYVRMRMAAGIDAGLALVSDHRGTTSVQSSGFDACVVPTLFDSVESRALVDSKRLSIDLALRVIDADVSLMPAGLRDSIEAELALVDELPNYQMLAVTVGRPRGDLPANQFALGKVRRCDALLAEHGDDPLLRAAYAAKRAKEQAAADKLFAPDALDAAEDGIASAVADLDRRLAAGEGCFLFGDRVTIADLFWGVELARIEDLGVAELWLDEALPCVAAYHEALGRLPAIRHALDAWPNARFKAERRRRGLAPERADTAGQKAL